MSGIRKRLTYANVVASLALFIALGGSSYAAVQLSKNSVRSKHIKNGQIKRVDLGRSVVDSTKVKDGALLAKDFAAGELPAGGQGAKGDKGETGAQGKTGPRGPAKLFARHVSGGITLEETLDPVVVMKVPEGKYLLSARIEVINVNHNYVFIECKLEATDGDGMESEEVRNTVRERWTSSGADTNANYTVTFERPASFVGEATLQLRCRSYRPGGWGSYDLPAKGLHARIHALQLDDLALTGVANED